MTRKIACIFALSGALIASAQAQQPTPPTKADAQKVVQIISADKAKSATYCQILTLSDEMWKASEAKDDKKRDALGQQLDDLSAKLGPEYLKLTEALDGMDPSSKESEALTTEFESLDKSCEK